MTRIAVRPFTFALLLAVTARTPLPAQTQLPLDPDVRTGRLDNGLTYYVRANRRPVERAELRLVVNAGSVLEDDDQRGLAHFVEHMAFNGTEDFEKQQIIDYLESIGMRFGADTNASTSFDETVYQITLPTDSGTALDTGLRILEQWAHRVTFDEAEIEKERGVVIEEWRGGRGAASRLLDKSLPVIFRGSEYAERLPIGTLESLQSVTREQLVRFYRDWYRPDLMAVVAVGDFDAADVERRIREHFAAIPAATEPRERVSAHIPPRTSPDVSVATDPEATNSLVRVYLLRPRSAGATEADYRRSLVESLFDAMVNGRLAELAQQPDPPFALGFLSSGPLVRTSDAVTATAVVENGGMQRGLDALLTEVQRVQRHGFTATELEREKADLLRAYERAYEERASTESSAYAGEYVRAYLEHEPIPGIAFEYELVQRLLPGITLDELNAVARGLDTERDAVIVAEAPESAPPPAGPELLAVMGGVAQRDIEPYRDVVATTPLVANAPTPGRIIEERAIEEIDAVEWRLSNGIRVFVKATDFKADEVVFQAFGPGGLSLASDDDHLSASMATTLISQSGVGDRTLIELTKELAGNTARVSPWIGELEEGLEGRASPRDIETALQLAWLYVTSPRADSATFISVRDRLEAFLANRSASPEAAFSDTLQLTMANHHVRARPLTAERLEEWDPATSFDFYRERFADVGDFTFVFVGAIDVDALRPLVERWIGGLPAAGRTDAWQDRGIRPPEGRIAKDVLKGLEPRSQTLLIFTGDAEYSPVERHRIASLADVLDIRLRELLREDLGGTYGAGVNGSIGRNPEPRFTFQIGFGSEPERLDELVEATFTEIRRLQNEGPDVETLAKVQETQRREWQTGLRENAFWAAQLARMARDQTSPDALLSFPQRVDALTVDDVRAAAQRYLTLESVIRVSLRPQTQ